MAKLEQLMHDTNTWRDRHPEKVKDVEARTQMAKSQNTNGKKKTVYT